MIFRGHDCMYSTVCAMMVLYPFWSQQLPNGLDPEGPLVAISDIEAVVYLP